MRNKRKFTFVLVPNAGNERFILHWQTKK